MKQGEEITERLTTDDGAKWVRVWRKCGKGIMQLIWTTEEVTA